MSLLFICILFRDGVVCTTVVPVFNCASNYGRSPATRPLIAHAKFCLHMQLSTRYLGVQALSVFA